MLNFSCLGRGALLAGLFGLAACSGGGSGWYRPNTAEAARDRDYEACRSEARAAAGPSLGINQDIAASRGSDWAQSGRTDAIEQNSSPGSDTFRIELSSCMQGRGYSAR
jgi:hypothetical protein